MKDHSKVSPYPSSDLKPMNFVVYDLPHGEVDNAVFLTSEHLYVARAKLQNDFGIDLKTLLLRHQDRRMWRSG